VNSRWRSIRVADPVLAALNVSLRPSTAEDLPFLRRVYLSMRQEQLAGTRWPPEQIDEFLGMQFEAQHSHYRDNYRDTSWDVILADGEPAGRLYVARWPEQVRIVDIVLLPEFRGLGIGSTLIRQLFEEAEATGRPVRMHVELNNRARALYERLGFRPVAESGISFEYERPPASADGATQAAS
jgi:ribosomal protein S18 acetylase RimI-like enzyme